MGDYWKQSAQAIVKKLTAKRSDSPDNCSRPKDLFHKSNLQKERRTNCLTRISFKIEFRRQLQCDVKVTHDRKCDLRTKSIAVIVGWAKKAVSVVYIF